MKVGIDIGGTFTDVILVSDTGMIKNYKIPSTPADPSRAVLQALSMMAGIHIDEVTHGSTVATNAILERKGAKTALLTTDGFRDNIYIQRQNKFDVYDPHYRKPVAIVPRDLVVEVKERISYSGEIIQPLDLTDLKEQLGRLVAENEVKSIAICLLHSYKNATHEQELASFLEETFPDIDITISSQVLPEFREYERASTTVLAAYLKPVVANYIERIEDGLRSAGARFLVMQSNGGILLGSGAKRHPGQMFLSGPAGGVTGAVHVGIMCDSRNLFTLDIGGTSTDAALITGGVPSVTTEKLIDGLPIAFPMIDIATIGAGGGSIAWVDDGGMLRVGPQSAGAEPGPACYGKNGNHFTVTDALVIMGLVHPDRFLGGSMKLDAAASRRAAEPLCQQLYLTAPKLAESVFRINLHSVTEAMRLVSIARGYDPRDYTMLAFGGGGPLHAALVATDLGIKEVIVPMHPGLFSAYGLLVSDFRRDYVLTEPMAIETASRERIEGVLAELRRKAEAEFSDMGMDASGLSLTFTVDVRYAGQGHDLNVVLLEDDLGVRNLSTLRERFDRVHLEKHGHNFPEDDVELVSFRAQALGPRKKPNLTGDDESDKCPAAELEAPVHWKGEDITVRLVDRRSLNNDTEIVGPAVIVETTSTTFVPAGWTLRPDSLGNLRLRSKA
jgi:N-methylhydantoinase A